MKSESRIKNSLVNSAFSIAGQFVSVILQFVLRSVFISKLGVTYLGVNGLFANVLQVLSLTELGLGTALVVCLYKPLADQNFEKIKAYVNAYKRVYAVIGAVIAVLGMCVIPFIPMLIKDSGPIEDINIIYILFLADSVASYYFAHYRALLSANQEDYVNTVNRNVFLIFQVILQVVFLYLFSNFIVYLTIKILMNLLSNLRLSFVAKRIHPYLKEKSNSKLSKSEIKNLMHNAIGTFSQKIGYTILGSTDNIIISAFIGTIVVGYYSNYSLLIGTITTILGLVLGAVQASIGNLCAQTSREQIHKQFLNINFVYFWLYSFCAVCLAVLSTSFINIWLGSEFEMSKPIILICVLNFYIYNSRQATLAFETSIGLLWKLKYKPIFEIIINLVVSIVLAKYIGIIGVFIGTLCASALTSLWIEPFVIYKCYFGKGLLKYHFQYIIRLLITIITYLLCDFICGFFSGLGIAGFIIQCGICICVINIIYIVFFYKTKQFKYFVNIIKNIFVLKFRSK